MNKTVLNFFQHTKQKKKIHCGWTSGQSPSLPCPYAFCILLIFFWLKLIFNIGDKM